MVLALTAQLGDTVCVFVCLCVRTYVCVHASLSLYVCVHASLSLCVCVCVQVCKSIKCSLIHSDYSNVMRPKLNRTGLA